MACITSLDVGDTSYRMIDLQAEADARGFGIAELPYVMRVLIENLLRSHALGNPACITEHDLSSTFAWQDNVGKDLPLYVSRVILPDSSGVPALQGLAALREEVCARGGRPDWVQTRLPVDLIIDHSLQVDYWAAPDAMARNMLRERERNSERYAFLQWCQQHFKGIHVYPPGTGIIHQVNLEQAARVVCAATANGDQWLFPDFVIGGDSHTTMVNALGVLGWGVGGIDAEAALLGQPYVFPLPEVIGVCLENALSKDCYTTDLALFITEQLRRENVQNCAVEFFGPAVAHLSVPERATLSNMAPEYGATCGFFAIDHATLAYLGVTGRPRDHIARIEAYAKRQGLFRDPSHPTPRYSRVVRIDLAQVEPSMSGPARPQDRLPLSQVGRDFQSRLNRPLAQGGFVTSKMPSSEAPGPGAISHGAIAVAALTSCTNTSNPEVMIAAGLVARACCERGLRPPPWVKTSLAPGSRAVTRYLEATGLLDPLRQLGFDVVGYGCTTCGGKSGPLAPLMAEHIEQHGIVAVSVLSGNRNFPGRIHKLVQANYLAAPPLVVAYAVAGRIDFDPESEPLAIDSQGQPVFLDDILPKREDIEALVNEVSRAEFYERASDLGDAAWPQGNTPDAGIFPWDPQSTYLVQPPFFKQPAQAPGLAALSRQLHSARALLLLGDSITTDHISPGGEIPVDSPAGHYLVEQGVAQRDFNTYVGRRGNHHIMLRATFANIRIVNQLTPDRQGGWTLHFPEGEMLTVDQAAARYQQEGVGTIVIAGAEYGTGSSRDWAAKGTALLGIRAVIAGSFERIHRSNLIGMGVLPLAFEKGTSWKELGLTGHEIYEFDGVESGVMNGGPITVTARQGEKKISFPVFAQVFTQSQRQLLSEGGMAQQTVTHILRSLA